MKELAKEELKLLETQHPNKFQYLKLQLKEFIHVLEEQEQEESFKRKQQHEQFHTPVFTQESSSRKRDREEEKDDGYSKRRRGRGEGIKLGGAIQKAEACLRKIQTLKKSLFRSSNH